MRLCDQEHEKEQPWQLRGLRQLEQLDERKQSAGK